MIDRLNRVLLTLLALLVAAAAVVGLLAGGGQLDVREPGSLYTDGADDVPERPELWGGVAIAVLVVLAVVGLVWAWRQVRPRREGGHLSPVELRRDQRGHTTVGSAALARMVADDLERLPGVVGSRVRVVEMAPRPRLIAWLDLGGDAEPALVRNATEVPLGRLCHALGVETVDADLRLRPTGTAPATARVA